MELVLEALWLLAELVIELIFGAADVGFLDVADAIVDPPPRRFWVCVGYAAAGFALGAGSVWLLPRRLLPLPATQGISLLLSPVVSGIAMHFWGSYRRAHGRPTTSMATFWGGAAFAFGCALGRFVAIG
ncbi:MAG: hypothetical protein ABW221_10945 [Vicinamibacteria bacterium]